jgi:hypothetical protein
MTIAFYGFQRAPDVRFVTPDTGWPGWFEDHANPLIERGFPDHHLHNPFGLHELRGRLMQPDQFELAYCQGLTWLANREAFADAVGRVHGRGGTVTAYVGSPLLIPEVPGPDDLPSCMPGSMLLSARLRLLRALGLCGGLSLPRPFERIRPLPRCLCWNWLIRFYIDVLVDAKVDVIGFDASPDFHPGDCMDRLVRDLIKKKFEVLIESWPLRGRTYPPVIWIIREQRFQRIKFDPRNDPRVETVEGTIQRIIPADDSPAGQAEIERINVIRERFGASPFSSTQEIVDSARAEGHVPLVRSRQLMLGAVT